MKLSVHMMILNGASVVERALRPLAALDAEVVVVDTDSTDGTPEFVEHLCGETFPGDYGKESRLRCKIAARLTPESHPGLYFKDLPSSWQTDMPGPFTGGPILRDWAAARNIGLDACHGDYILKLDADDEIVEGAAVLPSALQFLDSHPGINFLMVPYEIMESFTPNPLYGFSALDHIHTITMYDRIWRNKPAIRFAQAIHEYPTGKGFLPDGQPNWFMVAQGLRFRDWRDSPGNGVRLSHRNYKVFMREYERLSSAKAEISPIFLLSTIGEVTEANPNLALSLLRMAREPKPGTGLGLSPGPGVRTWQERPRPSCPGGLPGGGEARPAFRLRPPAPGLLPVRFGGGQEGMGRAPGGRDRGGQGQIRIQREPARSRSGHGHAGRNMIPKSP